MEVQLIEEANFDDEREVVPPLELLLGLFNFRLDEHSDLSEFALLWTYDVAIFKCTCGSELESRIAKCRGYVSVPSDFSSVSKSANMTLDEYIAREMVSQKDLPSVYCSRCKIHGPNPLYISIWKHYFELPYYLVLSLDPTGIYNLPEQLTIKIEKPLYGHEEDENEEEPVEVVKYRLIAKIMRRRDHAVEHSYSAIFRKNFQLFHYSQFKHGGYAQGEMENSLSTGDPATIAAFYVKEDIINDACTRPILISH